MMIGDEYLSILENSNPVISAVGITDYYSIDLYEKVLERKKDGRISNIQLIFPNVEVRLDIGTSSDKALNYHLLFSPEGFQSHK